MTSRVIEIVWLYLFSILLLILSSSCSYSFSYACSCAVPLKPKPQYSRSFVIPGSGTGYLPSGPGFSGAGESMVSLSIPGANS